MPEKIKGNIIFHLLIPKNTAEELRKPMHSFETPEKPRIFKRIIISYDSDGTGEEEYECPQYVNSYKFPELQYITQEKQMCCKLEKKH